MRRRRPAVEPMEDRTLLTSAILLDGLEFTGTFNQSESSSTSTGTVLIEYAQTQTEAVNRLLSTDGLVTIPTASDATSFTIAPANLGGTATLTLESLSANPTFWTTSTTATVDIGSLTSSGQSLGAGTAQALTVADVPFDAETLTFAIPAGANTSQAEVLLQSNLDFTTIGLSGLQLGVETAGDGNDVVVTGGSSASMTLTGVESSLQASFTAYGVAIAGTITAAYSADTDTFSFGGSVAFSADGMVNISSSLGDDTNVIDGAPKTSFARAYRLAMRAETMAAHTAAHARGHNG